MKFTNFFFRFGTRFVMFCYGYFWIRKIQVNFKPEKYPKLIGGGRLEDATIIISNHITFADIMHSFMIGRSFIGKREAAEIPFFGWFAKLLQAILIDRISKESRANTIKLLKERVELIQNKRNYRKLVIYVEGTTSNGKGLLDFKKGAFVLDTPLFVEGLKYKGRISNAYAISTFPDNSIGICLNFYNSLTIYTLDQLVYKKKKEMSWEEYSHEVRMLMCNEFGFKDFGGDYKDSQEFEKSIGFKGD